MGKKEPSPRRLGGHGEDMGKSNRGLRGGRGSDSLCALRPAACAQASGRVWNRNILRLPSAEESVCENLSSPGGLELNSHSTQRSAFGYTLGYTESPPRG